MMKNKQNALNKNKILVFNQFMRFDIEKCKCGCWL